MLFRIRALFVRSFYWLKDRLLHIKRCFKYAVNLGFIYKRLFLKKILYWSYLTNYFAETGGSITVPQFLHVLKSSLP